MRKLLFLYLFFSFLSLSAQDRKEKIAFIPNIGINFSYINKPIIDFPGTEEKSTKPKIGIAYTFGANLKFPISNSVALLTGVQYANNKYSFKDISIENRLNKYFYGSSLSTSSIELPIIFSYKILTSNFSINTGFQLGYIFSAHSKTNIKSYSKDNNNLWSFKDEEQEKIDIKSLIRKEKISIPIGFSYELSNLYFSLSYNFEMTKIYQNNHSQNVTFKVGYKM